MVVCRLKQQQSVFWGVQRCGSHCSGGVAGNGLQQDGAMHACRIGAVLHQETMVFTGYDDLLCRQQRSALQRQLQQAFALN
jgi:hypothetical protein